MNVLPMTLALALPLSGLAAAQSTAFGWGYIGGSRFPMTFDTNDAVATWSELPASMPHALYGLDFDASATTLYAISYSVGYYGVVDQATGAFTISGTSNLPAGKCYGLTAHPDGVTWYAIVVDNPGNETQIWKTTGTFEEFVPIGAPTPGIRLWSIACRADGALFGMQVTNDTLYSIDPVTGDIAAIGALGFDANFVQDMDFDWSTGKLLATLSGFPGVHLAEIDTATGTATLLEDLTALTAQATIAIAEPRPPVIAEACVPNPNVTGVPTALVGDMSSPVGSGLHLEATDGPPSALGLFVYSSGLNLPGFTVSNGNLCVSLSPGETSGRYSVPGGEFNSIGFFDPSGVFVNASGTSTVGTGYDVPSTTPGPGAVALDYGSTWHFQLWHRDGPGASNFSNAVSVTF